MTAPTDVDRWVSRSPSRPPSLYSRGLLAQPFPVSDLLGGAVLTSQAIVGCMVDLYAGDVASGVAFEITQAGSGTTPTNVYAALLDLSGNRLAVTADSKASTALTAATGLATLAFASAYTVVTSGAYYAVFLENGAFGTNTLQLGRVVGGTGAGSALGSNAAFAVTQTGQTSIPNPATLTASDTMFWIAVV